MAHHRSTPRRVLDAPVLTPVLAWDPHQLIPNGQRRRGGSRVFGPFVGNVQGDLLGSERPAQLATRRKARHAAAVAERRANPRRVDPELVTLADRLLAQQHVDYRQPLRLRGRGA